MIITLDFETYYSTDYSLSKISEVDYILSPLFEAILCAIKIDDREPIVAYGHARVAQSLALLPWDKAALLSHNTRFDGAILSWIFGIQPKFYLDTLSMARALTHATIGRSSLKKVAEYLGLPPKGDEVVAARGMRAAQFSPSQLRAYGAYSAHDANLSKSIFNHFMNVFPTSELRVIDLSLRMFLQPQVKLNSEKLAQHLLYVQAEKQRAMDAVAWISPECFSSQKKFAHLLETYGVEVPMKISPITGTEIPALAKNDQGFKELCADESQTSEVQALLAARLSAKSTIEETRSVTLLNLSQRDWGAAGPGWMPVPYRYWGAHTGRFSGDGGFNFANLKRASPIRDAIEAPAGFRVVHRDSSQIEARMVAWLARCASLLVAFRDGRDIYSEFATRFYNQPVTKADKLRRFVGKTCILGLGYGMGAKRLRHTLFIGSGGMSAALSEEESENLVEFYRMSYEEIGRLWQEAKRVVECLILLANRKANQRVTGSNPHWTWISAIELGHDAIVLPNGMHLCYPGVCHQRVATDQGWDMQTGYIRAGSFVKLFGGKVVENISQALARIVLTDIMTRVHDRSGYHPFMTTYDSVDYCVPVEDAAAMDALLAEEFAIAPKWAHGLPLASEGGFGRTLLVAEDERHAEHNQ